MKLFLPTLLSYIACSYADIDEVPYGSSCTKDTQCREFGTWPGGKGNCNNGTCECLITHKCQEDRQCCSGKCANQKCVDGPLGSICSNYTVDVNKSSCSCAANSCEKDLVCEVPQADVKLTWPYGSQFGICGGRAIGIPGQSADQGKAPPRDTCVNNVTDCKPMGHWPGGLGNCLKGLCDCRIHGVCQRDSDCCSNKCLGKRCQPGNEGDACQKGTCKGGLECHIPNGTLCTGTCGVSALVYAPCAPSITHCIDVGGWAGGSDNCKNDRCECITKSPCAREEDCCSGICYANGTCASGDPGDICDLSTCKPNANCIAVATNESTNGILQKCFDCEPFSARCQKETVCCQKHKWVGGQSVCTSGLCECKSAEKCSLDRECCSNVCNATGYCAPAGEDYLCKPGIANACQEGLYCNRDNGPKSYYGFCEKYVCFGGQCNSDTVCQAEGRWPGGLDNCKNHTCMCSNTDENCKKDAECCSNDCVNSRCAAGVTNTYCAVDTCAKGHDCKNNVVIVEPVKPPCIHVTTSCQKCENMNSPCTSETFCCNGIKSTANISWLGGVGNCFDGICECQTINRQCNSNQKCCTNICEGGICRNTTKGESTCTQGTDDCGNNQGCTGISTVPTPLKGTCEDCTIFGKNCSAGNISYCCPLSSWPGKYGNCFEGACKCLVYEKCTEDRQCCSGKCNESQCVPGNMGDACKNDSCSPRHECNIPSNNKTVAQWLKNEYGTCEACLPYNSVCTADTTCCKADKWVGGYGNCYKGKCACIVDNAKETCKHNRECCNNRCVDSHCEPGNKTEWCDPNSCLYPLKCSDKNVFDPNLGRCQPCTALGQQCNDTSHCCSVTTWPGGKGACLDGICSCRTQDECRFDKDCCSGNCTNRKCGPGPDHSICTNGTCDEGFKCPVPSNNTVVDGVFNTTRGTCVDDTCGWAHIHFKLSTVKNDTITGKKYRAKQQNTDRVTEDGWPWLAHISFDGNRTFAGVLLSPRFVLTAAEIDAPGMVEDISKIKVEIGALRTGSIQFNSIRSVNKIISHPNAFRNGKRTNQNDLAILRLSADVLPSDSVAYPCIADGPRSTDFESCAVGGWTKTKTWYKVAQETVTIVDGENCPSHDIAHVCAMSRVHNEHKKKTCENNYGGPLVCMVDKDKTHEKWALHGIASFNLECDKPETPFGFEDVSFYKNWIVGEINKKE